MSARDREARFRLASVSIELCALTPPPRVVLSPALVKSASVRSSPSILEPLKSVPIAVAPDMFADDIRPLVNLALVKSALINKERVKSARSAVTLFKRASPRSAPRRLAEFSIAPSSKIPLRSVPERSAPLRSASRQLAAGTSAQSAAELGPALNSARPESIVESNTPKTVCTRDMPSKYEVPQNVARSSGSR